MPSLVSPTSIHLLNPLEFSKLYTMVPTCGILIPFGSMLYEETTSWKNEAGSALQEKSHRKTCLEKWPADWCVIYTLS